jgi:SulP family sulfate permease
MTDAALLPTDVPADTSAAQRRARVRSYPWSAVRADLVAGVTVAAISLPQSMAYALIAGVDPRFGLYTAIIFTAVAGLLGSSRHLINGPTGAVSLVVFSALAFIDPEARVDAYEAMFLLTVMVGAVQIAIAVFRLGDLTRYISESVVTGFIAGAAALTIVGQVANALGVKAQGNGHQHVLYRLWLTLSQDAPFNLRAVSISVGSIVLALLARRVVRRFKLPQLDMFVVLLLVTLVAWLAGWTQHAGATRPVIALIAAVPATLPHPHIAQIQWRWLLDMSSSATAIAVLGLLEALSIAKAIAHKSRQTLDYNRQCVAEGIGNVVGGFFSCMPGSGSLSRTALNYQAGAQSRFSGVITAVVVAIVVLTLGPLTAYIPTAALAGLLIVAAARLIDLERVRYIVRGSRYDATLLIATALSALVIDVEFAILVGVALSVLWYVPRAGRLKAAELVITPERVVRERVLTDPPSRDVLIIDLEGELFFGAVPELVRHLAAAASRAKQLDIGYLVLRLKRVRNPDVVALEELEKFLRDARASGLTVLLAGVRAELLSAIQRVGITRTLSAELIFAEEDEAYSATLQAIRKAYALRAQHNSAVAETDDAGGDYYLV